MLGKEEELEKRVTRLTVKSNVEIELKQTKGGEGVVCLELAKLENDKRNLPKAPKEDPIKWCSGLLLVELEKP